MSILVTGGAGYIGSHMVKRLVAEGESVIVVDDLSSGHRDAVLGAELIELDICDRAALTAAITGRGIRLVMHFASRIEVGESVTNPGLYFRSIVAGSVSLLEAMATAGIRNLVFSSSAAVYGEPTTTTLAEDHARKPVNAYGRAKNMVEDLLPDFGVSDGIRSVALRYFNAAGAAADGSLGERHDPETHLVPLLLQAASGRRPSFKIFGTDYDTADGTCVRDFVHVDDLCHAHRLAAAYLEGHGGHHAFNLGSGTGFSVRAVVQAARRVTGVDFSVGEATRRPGDPARLVADIGLAANALGWRPRENGLDEIIRDAWNWEQSLCKAG